MLGKLKSARTKEEWEAFQKDLYNKEKYIIGIEGFKYYPFGEKMIKQIDFMLKTDATIVLNDKGIGFDFLTEKIKQNIRRIRRNE